MAGFDQAASTLNSLHSLVEKPQTRRRSLPAFLQFDHGDHIGL
jgi:hypothetical protein